MKSRLKIFYICKDCGFTAQKWLGRCPSCYAWNTFQERKEQPYLSTNRRDNKPSEVKPETLKEVRTDAAERITTGISELDRVLGGGLVRGSAVLIGGLPGIGKSTLMLQAAERLSRKISVLYISAEESAQQLKSRADRLGISSDKIFIVSESNIAEVLAWAENQKIDCIIADSIQAVYREDFQAGAGSLAQVRECAQTLVSFAKKKNTAVFILGHVTKDGDIAGPKLLEHLVDTVLYFEVEKQQSLRMLKAHKNRFGAVSEIALFEMTSSGLKEVANSSEYFLGRAPTSAPGSCLVSVMEGSRVLFLEVQALVCRTNFGFPKRMTSGYDYNRVALLIALLENKLGIPLGGYDVFVNVVSGFKIQETSADLGILLSIASAFYNSGISGKTLIIGEAGLTGEIRSVPFINERLSAAMSAGFKKVILPASCSRQPADLSGKVEIVCVNTALEALRLVKSEVAQLG